MPYSRRAYGDLGRKAQPMRWSPISRPQRPLVWRADAGPPSAKPAIEVTTDFGVAPAPEAPVPPPSAEHRAAHRDAIVLGLSRGRNAMAIWQDLVDTRGFQGGYQSVNRFVRKLLGSPSKAACAVIETAGGEEALQ